MRLDINLASQPYEDARQFWMRWGSAVGAVALLTLALLTITITGWLNARRDHAAISQKKTLIAERDRQRAEAEAFLNRPENRSTRDESQFLNQLIERKAFSWTRVLESLEKVMPPRVHLVTISPGLDDENQLLLKMTVAGDSRERAVELARRMEESRRFAQTSITHEQMAQNQSGDNEMFEMVAIYIPEPIVPVQQSAPDKKKEATPKTSKPKPKPNLSKPRAVAALGS
jgi:Tfp pilus assembly protein PilN